MIGITTQATVCSDQLQQQQSLYYVGIALGTVISRQLLSVHSIQGTPALATTPSLAANHRLRGVRLEYHEFWSGSTSSTSIASMN
eukprot:scaffold270760_cov41-Prasinocladus_malaysianus.AAC.1